MLDNERHGGLQTLVQNGFRVLLWHGEKDFRQTARQVQSRRPIRAGEVAHVQDRLARSPSSTSPKAISGEMGAERTLPLAGSSCCRATSSALRVRIVCPPETA